MVAHAKWKVVSGFAMLLAVWEAEEKASPGCRQCFWQLLHGSHAHGYHKQTLASQNSCLNPVSQIFSRNIFPLEKWGYSEVIISYRNLYFLKLWMAGAPRPNTDHLVRKGDLIHSLLNVHCTCLSYRKTIIFGVPGPEEQLGPACPSL